jgi:hypothetical protein
MSSNGVHASVRGRYLPRIKMTVHVAIAANALSWANYLAVPSSRTPSLDAFTFVRIDPPDVSVAHGSGPNPVLRVSRATIRVSVDRSRSWVVNGRGTATLLEHERLHYRIGILIANELDGQVLTQSAPSAPALRSALQSAVDRAGTRMGAIFDAYDRDTAHARNAQQQQAWQRRMTGWEQQRRISFP